MLLVHDNRPFHLCTALNYIKQLYMSKIIYFAKHKILKTVDTQFYPSFDLCRPEETSTRTRPITLGER